MLTSKITTEIIENHPEFSGCMNSCNKFVTIQSRSVVPNRGGIPPRENFNEFRGRISSL